MLRRMCSARAASGGGGTAAARVGVVAAAPSCATLLVVSTYSCTLLVRAAMAVRRCCFVGGPGCAALALLSTCAGDVELELAAAPSCWLLGCAALAKVLVFCGRLRRMSAMEAPRCRLAGMPGSASLPLPKGRFLVRPATSGCSALVAARANAAGCSAVLALGSSLLAAPARAAGCSALLAEAPVRTSRLARSLLPSAITACCSFAIKVGNGRRCFPSPCFTFHEEQRGLTSSHRSLRVFVSTVTAARSFLSLVCRTRHLARSATDSRPRRN